MSHRIVHEYPTLGTPMGIILTDAAPDFARRQVRAPRSTADDATGARNPGDIVPIKNGEDPTKAVACTASIRAPPNAHRKRIIVFFI